MDAIVLRRGDYGETDRLITLYTLPQGKVRTIAKGVRRITSRMAGHLDLLTYSTILLIQGRTLDLITQCQTIEGFAGLRGDVWRTTYGCYVAELVDRFTEDSIPNPPLFAQILRTLHQLATLEAEHLTAAVRAFELSLLSLSGYQPELRQCLECREPLRPETNFFSAEAGGALCPRCGQGHARARSIGVDSLKVLRNLQARPDTIVGRVLLPDAVMADVQEIMAGYIQRLLERQPRSAGFIDTLARLYPGANDEVREQERLSPRHSSLATGA